MVGKKTLLRVHHVDLVNIKSMRLVLSMYVIIQNRIVILQIAQLMLWRNNMPVIQIDEKELLTVTDSKDVSVNGQISIGRKFAGKVVRAYVIEVKEE